MNAKLRIPTDMYAFVEIDVEGSFEEIAVAYREAKDHILGGEGVTPKEFNDFIDEYLTTKQIVNGGDIYERMNLRQKDIIQTIKRSFNRIK